MSFDLAPGAPSRLPDHPPDGVTDRLPDHLAYGGTDGPDDRWPGRLVGDALAGRRGARARLLDGARRLDRAGGGPLDELLDALAASAAGGDRLAATMLLEVVHHLGLARPAIVRLLHDPMAVDDAVQATLVTVERRISSFQSRSRFRTWLFAVARNEALMALRRRRPDPVDPLEPLGPLGARGRWGPEIEDPRRTCVATRFSTAVVSRQLIDDLIGRLPAPYGETMRLRVTEQLDYEQIADRLGIPIGTVRSRLAKARDLLRCQV